MMALPASSPLASSCRTKAVMVLFQPVGFCAHVDVDVDVDVDAVVAVVVRDGEDIAG